MASSKPRNSAPDRAAAKPTPPATLREAEGWPGTPVARRVAGMTTRATTRRVGLAALGVACCLVARTAAAQDAGARAGADAGVAAVDDAAITAFVLAYDRALAAGDAAFLTAHTRWPLRVRYVVYDNEGRVVAARARSAAQLRRLRAHVGLPSWFVQSLGRGERFTGEPLCPPPGTQEPIDAQGRTAPERWRRGPSPYTAQGDAVRVRFVAADCGADGHVGVWTLRRDARGWALADVDVEY